MHSWPNAFLLVVIMLLFVFLLSYISPKLMRIFHSLERFFQLPTTRPLEVMTQLIFQYGIQTSRPLFEASFVDEMRYKFYGELVKQSIRNQKIYGLSCLSQLKSLRAQMQQDLKKERVLSMGKRQSLIQFAGMSLMTWLLIFTSLQQFSTNFILISWILLWQLFGMMVYIFLLKWRYHKLFHCFPWAIQSINTYWCLSQLEISQKDKLERSEVDKWQMKWAESKDKFFSMLNAYLQQCLIREKQLGVSIQEECEVILQELWSGFEMKTEEYLQFLHQVQMFVAVVFFLSSFMWVIYNQATSLL